MASRRNIFTAADRKTVLKEMIAEDKGNNRLKELDKLAKEPEFWDKCPYCHELVRFDNAEPKRIKVRNKDFLEMQCSKCDKAVYMFIDIIEGGDMMGGYTYDPVAQPITKELVYINSEEEKPKLRIERTQFTPKPTE